MAAQPKPKREPLPPLKMHKAQLLPARSLHLIAYPHGYGRPLRPYWVTRLISQWDDQKAGTLLVSCRADDRLYYVLAGNHRVAARMQDSDPDYLFDCKVHYGLDRAEEAAIYLAQDAERLRHTVADDFGAMLTRGDSTAEGVARVLGGLNLEIAPYGESGWRPDRVRAVSALLAAYDVNGEANLREALELLRDEWGPEQVAVGRERKSVYSEATVGSLSALLRLYPDLERPWLRKAMQREHYAGWQERWQHHRMAAKSRPQGGIALIYGILAWLDLYNYRRREDNQLDELVARRATKTLARRRLRGGAGR